MDVFDHLTERVWFPDVAVVTSAPLPEAVAHFAVGLFIAQMLQEFGRLAAEVS